MGINENWKENYKRSMYEFPKEIFLKQMQQAELDETLTELKNADELSKKASADAARLAEELRQEQEHSQHVGMC